MNAAVFLFPGQGSQFVGMGKDLYESSELARETYRQANEALGVDLAAISFEGPEEELTKTKNTQPAILTHSVAVLRELEARGVEVRAAAGHSLGEYSAYVAAGSLSFADAVRLVRTRGELMYEAGLARPGTMAAILGLTGPVVEALCEDVTEGVVCAANLNSPGQVVISGEPAGVEAAMAKAKEAGAKRAVRLNVSGAFHSPLMESAFQGLTKALRDVEIHPAKFPVVANASADVVTEPEAIRESLARQLLNPVRWEASMRRLIEDPGPAHGGPAGDKQRFLADLLDLYWQGMSAPLPFFPAASLAFVSYSSRASCVTKSFSARGLYRFTCSSAKERAALSFANCARLLSSSAWYGAFSMTNTRSPFFTSAPSTNIRFSRNPSTLARMSTLFKGAVVAT